MEAILEYKAVEPVCGDDNGARNSNPHVLPLVVELVFEQDVVQEREPAGFAAERALAEPCETYGVVVTVVVKAGYDSDALTDAEVADEFQVQIPDSGDVPVVLDADWAEFAGKSEQSSRVEPA